jgi:hypothetical protein
VLPFVVQLSPKKRRVRHLSAAFVDTTPFSLTGGMQSEGMPVMASGAHVSKISSQRSPGCRGSTQVLLRPSRVTSHEKPAQSLSAWHALPEGSTQRGAPETEEQVRLWSASHCAVLVFAHESLAATRRSLQRVSEASQIEEPRAQTAVPRVQPSSPSARRVLQRVLRSVSQ